MQQLSLNKQYTLDSTGCCGEVMLSAIFFLILQGQQNVTDKSDSFGGGALPFYSKNCLRGTFGLSKWLLEKGLPQTTGKQYPKKQKDLTQALNKDKGL